jgi:hypothetical protein
MQSRQQLELHTFNLRTDREIMTKTNLKYLRNCLRKVRAYVFCAPESEEGVELTLRENTLCCLHVVGGF